jgi:hypothetical protein
MVVILWIKGIHEVVSDINPFDGGEGREELF